MYALIMISSSYHSNPSIHPPTTSTCLSNNKGARKRCLVRFVVFVCGGGCWRRKASNPPTECQWEEQMHRRECPGLVKAKLRAEEQNRYWGRSSCTMRTIFKSFFVGEYFVIIKTRIHHGHRMHSMILRHAFHFTSQHFEENTYGGISRCVLINKPLMGNWIHWANKSQQLLRKSDVAKQRNVLSTHMHRVECTWWTLCLVSDQQAPDKVLQMEKVLKLATWCN